MYNTRHTLLYNVYQEKKDIKNYELYVLVKLKNRTTVFSGI